MIPTQTFFHSVRVAISGLCLFFSKERNGRIQLIIAGATIVISALIGLSKTEWQIILFCIALVLISEMMNSAIEKVCNLISEAYHPGIKVIKDISAGAVLLACLISAVIGGIIFLPKIILLAGSGG